jgi:hypothetical protein
MHRLCLRTNALSFALKPSRSLTSAMPQSTLRSSWQSRSRIRTYSTSGDAERRDLLKKHGPPISIVGAAGEAATALFVRASMDKAQERVEASVRKLLDQLRADKELRSLLRSSNDPGSALTQENVDKLAGILQKNLGLDEATTEFFGNDQKFLQLLEQFLILCFPHNSSFRFCSSAFSFVLSVVSLMRGRLAGF